jgi:hypothetical protein
MLAEQIPRADEGLNGKSCTPRYEPEPDYARRARAIRIRITNVERERKQKARRLESYERERVHLLDEIIADGVTLRRLRAAEQKLERFLEWRRAP